MIGQHFYTRERRGIFKPTAGYDTVAKSPSLADAFIKEKIHPYCVYNGDGSNAITVAHYPCGKMLFGQAVHVPKDFTGQRAAFFAHNYIFPAEAVDDFLSEIEKSLCTRFETSYDINLGGELKELENLPHDKKPDEFPNVNHEAFVHIKNCIIESIAKSRKTYILVPPEISNKNDFACAVLVKIFENLPEGVKHLLGFCTFTCEIEKRKNIHLVFLDKNFYEKNISRFVGDFIVDFTFENSTQLPAQSHDEKAFDYIFNRILSLSTVQFFSEINFWHARIPNFSLKTNEAASVWLEKNLEKFSAQQFAAIPADFIKCGKSGESPAIYVILSILKKVSAALISKREISLRYFLGNYFLSPANYTRTVQNLRRIYKEYENTDAEFLFRERATDQ